MLSRSRVLLPLLLTCALSLFAADNARTLPITILYSTDFHAAVEPMKATWLVDQPMIGGIRNFAGWVDAMRRTQPNTFLFDSGDLYTGQAISFLTRGRAPVEMFKAIGYDAVCY